MNVSRWGLLYSPLFLAAAAVKLAGSFFFGSEYLTSLFIPFVNRYVLSGFQNPWEFFYALGRTNMFPYPPLMLWIMSVPRILFSPLLPAAWETVTPFHLFVMRLPLLGFDLFLFYLLLKLFPVYQKRVTSIYWCSPIVYYINYVHGQLDIVPTAIVFAAIILLVRKKHLPAMVCLAAAAATKSHVFIALPFFVIYLYKERIKLWHQAAALGIFLAAYGLFISPYIASTAFREMVFNSPEQDKVFAFAIQLSDTLKLVICPTVIALLFMKFVSYKKLNREILFMFLGVTFACFVVFVPPMPGWFLWSLPFLIYFYVRNKEYSRAPFVLYNLIYMVYFLFFFEKKTTIPGMTDAMVDNLALSLLMSTVGFIAIWMFRLGIEKNEELKRLEAPLLIGIGGDSGSGKHTLYNILRVLVGRERCMPIFGDNFHKWERGNENWKVYSHLDPKGNKLHEEADNAIALREGKPIEMVHYDHDTGKFTDPQVIEPNKFVFFIGLHPFYLKRMRDLMQIKIFLATDESLRRYWKIRRDMLKRGYSKEKVLEQIEARVEDSAKYIQPQARFSDLIINVSTSEPIDPEHPPHGKIGLRTRYTMDNSVNLDRLVAELEKISTLEIRHVNDIDKQELEVKGTVQPREIMRIAYNLELNFDELLVKTDRWNRNHKGVTQLVFLLIYNHKMEAR